MKKKELSVALMCFVTMGATAQIYGYDSYVQLPTRNLYDNSLSDMYIRALAETAARRKETFYRNSDLVSEAFNKKSWNYVIYYVNEALKTQYESGNLYYLRGYAFEQLGNLRAAKKDYKAGRRLNSVQAIQALESLKSRKKRK